MYLDIVAIVVSVVSISVALFALMVSLRRYELQLAQHELQKKDFEEKYKAYLYIKDEQFLTSHTLDSDNAKYYVEHPEEIEFEYQAKYINKGNAIINIESLKIIIDAVEIDEMFMSCGDRVLENAYIPQNEEIEIKHRINKQNLKGFKRCIDEMSEKRGVLEFSVVCTFSANNGETKEHKKILYRLVQGGGDRSYKEYQAGKGREKNNFLY